MSETKEEKQRDRETGAERHGADTKRQREWARQSQTDQRQTIRGR